MTAIPIAHTIWDMKYRLKGADGSAVDANVEATWRRVAVTCSVSRRSILPAGLS